MRDWTMIHNRTLFISY